MLYRWSNSHKWNENTNVTKLVNNQIVFQTFSVSTGLQRSTRFITVSISNKRWHRILPSHQKDISKLYISLPKKSIRLPHDAHCSLQIISEKVPQQVNLDLDLLYRLPSRARKKYQLDLNTQICLGVLVGRLQISIYCLSFSNYGVLIKKNLFKVGSN